MQLLLCGPPASGKSHAALERFRAISDSCLIVPTATMAEHVGHELARSGFPVRPSRIRTLAGLLNRWDLPQAAPRALLHALVEQALESNRPAPFAEVAEFRGFQGALADLIEEVPEEQLAACGAEFRALGEFVRARLDAAGAAHRYARLRMAAQRVRAGDMDLPPHLVFDGFFTFSPAELDLLEALAGRVELTITLPEFSGAAGAIARLEAAGFELRKCSPARRSPARVAFSTSTEAGEAEQIARRILDHAAHGRPFREMGVILRSREPYGPLIETTLARFGIPARSYFADPLEAHPAIRFLSGLVKACLEGWDHEALLALMRMPVSGRGATPEGDRADFMARKNLPGRGLPFAGLDGLDALDALRRERLEPQAWAERLQSLRALIPAPVIEDHAGRDRVAAWRSTAAALNALDDALAQAAAALPPLPKLPLAAFWKQAETVLALQPLRVPDNRRNVVRILDVYEARQWELPVVFVCGMLERRFPAYHAEDPLLGDALRARLGLATAAQRNAEERFLFDLAVSRAGSEVVLSYSRFDDKGDKTLPSFFLEGMKAEPCPERVRPAPRRDVTAPAPAPIQAPALLREIARRHRKLSATSIDSFLQCPFQFFARYTLELSERPPAPRDRLDARVKGNIIHKALAEWIVRPLLAEGIFDRVFEDECARLRIPRSYRTEAVRLELARHFAAFLEHGRLDLGWQPQAEIKFEFAATPQVTIRGRIDRLETGPAQQALVIDYKYSAPGRIKDHIEAADTGEGVQAGIYLLAAEQVMRLHPVGMLFCGLKKKITWGGWHLPIAGLERLGTSGAPEVLLELIESSLDKISETYESIAQGRIEVQPASDAKCSWCEFRDACRVESKRGMVQIGAAS